MLTLLRSLPTVTGLGVGFAGEFSREVGLFISAVAEKGSVVLGRFGCCHGSDQARGARRDRELRAARFWPNPFARRCEDPVGCPCGYLDGATRAGSFAGGGMAGAEKAWGTSGGHVHGVHGVPAPVVNWRRDITAAPGAETGPLLT